MTQQSSLFVRLRAFAHLQLGPYRPDERHLSGANCLIVVVVLVSLVLFTLESDPDFTFHDTTLVKWLTCFILGVFCVEFVLRLFAAGHEEQYRGLRGHLRFIRHNWILALVDLLAFAPELTFIVLGLRPRAWLRTLRVVRMFKLARYMPGISLIFEAVRETRNELYHRHLGRGGALVSRFGRP